MIFRTFTKGLMAGIGFGVGLLVVAAAVTVGTIKTWKSGETLKADEMNSTIAALKTAIESIAPWALNGTDAAYTGGKVGIGTASPAELLHAYSKGAWPAIRVEGTDAATGAALALQADSRKYTVSVGGSSNPDGFANKLFVWDAMANAGRLVLDSNGNVGIGTTSPSHRLTVSGGALQLHRSATAPATCDSSNGGAMYFDTDLKGTNVSGYQSVCVCEFDKVANVWAWIQMTALGGPTYNGCD